MKVFDIFLFFLPCFVELSYSHKDHKAQGDICHQEKEKGPCRGALPRFWYNDQTNQCEQFIYGGCQGSHNNFHNEVDCVQACVQKKENTITHRKASDKKCRLPKLAGTCKAAKLRYWYNFETNKCEEFIYGGCDGNENNFLNENDCLKECADEKDTQPTLVLYNQTEHHRNIDQSKSNGNIKGYYLMLIIPSLVFHLITR